jgi:replicative DNA helicase
MFLHRNEEDNKDVQQGTASADTLEVDLIVAKQRQGPTCTVPLVFFKTTTYFAEMERRRDGPG